MVSVALRGLSKFGGCWIADTVFGGHVYRETPER